MKKKVDEHDLEAFIQSKVTNKPELQQANKPAIQQNEKPVIRTKRLTIRMPMDVHTEFKVFAARKHTSMEQMLNDMIIQALEQWRREQRA